MPQAGAPILTPLSKFVMKQATADWKQYFADLTSPLKLAVNIPLSVIVAPGFIDLARSSLPNDWKFPGLIIEAREGEIVEDLDLAHEVITQLKLYNISLSVDDYFKGPQEGQYRQSRGRGARRCRGAQLLVSRRD